MNLDDALNVCDGRIGQGCQLDTTDIGHVDDELPHAIVQGCSLNIGEADVELIKLLPQPFTQCGELRGGVGSAWLLQTAMPRQANWRRVPASSVSRAQILMPFSPASVASMLTSFLGGIRLGLSPDGHCFARLCLSL